MTPEGARSDWVTAEIDQAKLTHRPIRPLLLAGTRFFALAHLQYEAVIDGGLPSEGFVTEVATIAGLNPLRPHSVIAPVAMTPRTPIPAGEFIGRVRATLTGHTDWVTKVAIAPAGTWL